MLKSYVTLALRNLMRHKGYSLINIAGLSIGMTCCVLMLLLVQDEWSYDRHHQNANRIYRLAIQVQNPQTGEFRQRIMGPYRLGEALRTDVPDLAWVRFNHREETLSYGEKQFAENRFFLADPNVFDVFTFPLMKGDPHTALDDPFSVVITEATAKKYFGSEEAMGKVLVLGGDHHLTVTGVLEDRPENIHFRFDLLGSMKAAPLLFNRLRLENWSEGSVYTYALLPPNKTVDDLSAVLQGLVDKHLGNETVTRQHASIVLMPLTDIHLYSHSRSEIEANGDIVYVYAFSAIALFVLLIACINFMNLATARSAARAREVGLRKVVGASRPQLIRQFLAESTLLSVLAMLLSLAMVELALPWFNGFVEKDLRMNYFDNPTAILGLVCIALFVGIVAGSYPALFLSHFQAVTVLKGTFRSVRSGVVFRKVLVGFQFAISTFLLIATGIIYDQITYARHIKLGYNTETVIALPSIPEGSRRNFESIKKVWLAHPGLRALALTSHFPSGRLGSNIPTQPEGIAEGQGPPMATVWVGYDFFETLGMSFSAGRVFSAEHTTDESSAFIVNEAACRELGWTASNAVGRSFGSQYLENWSDGRWKNRKGQIIGVVRDVYFESLKEPIKPMVFFLEPYMAWGVIASIQTANTDETIAFIKQKYLELYPEESFNFEYVFLDDRFDHLYRAEEKHAQIFGVFALLAIFVGCLGLFGLAAFTTEQRTKELGIRKVLGESGTGVIALLSKDFAKLILISNVFSWPAAFWVMNHWLQNFAYRIDLRVSTFLMGSALALVIALVTVGYQSIRAAIANPVVSLRYE
jgi:putative ABC transport system permease protein